MRLFQGRSCPWLPLWVPGDLPSPTPASRAPGRGGAGCPPSTREIMTAEGGRASGTPRERLSAERFMTWRRHGFKSVIERQRMVVEACGAAAVWRGWERLVLVSEGVSSYRYGREGTRPTGDVHGALQARLTRRTPRCGQVTVLFPRQLISITAASASPNGLAAGAGARSTVVGRMWGLSSVRLATQALVGKTKANELSTCRCSVIVSHLRNLCQLHGGTSVRTN